MKSSRDHLPNLSTHQLLESPIDALMIVDHRGLIQMVNSQMEQMFGYSRQELLGQAMGMLLPQRFRELHEDHMVSYFANPRMRPMGTGLELYGLRKNGDEFPLEISLNPLQSTGKPLVSAAIRDISERKATQQALFESQQRVAMHVANTPLAVLEWRTHDGIITAWNPAAEKLFGYTALEVIEKKRVDFIISEDQRSKFEVVLHGNLNRLRNTQKNITKDHRLISCEWYYTLLSHTHDKRMAALVLDITTRQRAINELVTVQEEERTRIARDLHDHVGQLLTGLNLGLTAAIEKPSKEKLLELKSLARTILEDVRRISRDLRPALLDELGLAAAIKRFARELVPEGSMSVDVLVHVPQTLERDTAIVIYRVTQEALTNVVRHAKALHVSVVVTTSEDAVQLIIEDDGVGFDPTHVAVTEHVGLSSMRERVELLGGVFAVESLPNKGTTISAELPLG
jgi:PAS domain S-box-containing protein